VRGRFTTQDLIIEAGVSLQTSIATSVQDELLLALIADAMTKRAIVDRLLPIYRSYGSSAVLHHRAARVVRRDSDEGAGMRFMCPPLAPAPQVPE